MDQKEHAENDKPVETETFYDLLRALENRIKKLENLAGIRDSVISN